MDFVTADIPGLNKTPREKDLEESRSIYNGLPDDARQPQILESHIQDLAALFVRYHAHEVFGIHLVHSHFDIPEETVLLGTNYDEPHCRWAKPSTIQTVNLDNVHGHIFVLTDHGFHPYEYQVGPAPDLSRVSDAFLHELAYFLVSNNLAQLVGLQIIDPCASDMLELVLPQGTFMVDASRLKGCVPTRQTGWQFGIEHGQPRVCQANEVHAATRAGHEVYNKGDPHPRLEKIQDVVRVLAELGLLV